MSLSSFVRHSLSRLFRKEEEMKPQQGLKFYTVVLKEDDYGRESPKATKVSGPKEFYEKFLFKQNADHNLRLITATCWENKHFPMVDVDNERDYLAAKTFLDSNAFDYAMWESSPGRYWFLVDRWFSNGAKAVEFARSVPGCDEKYCSAANSCGFCAMRLSSKGKFTLSPRMLTKAKSEKLKQFCTALEDFFSSKEKELDKLNFHRALFHKTISLAAPGRLGEKKTLTVSAERGDLISFHGCLRLEHKDEYNSAIREELGSDLLEGVVMGVDRQGAFGYYVVYVDSNPTMFGKNSKKIKTDFEILTPYYVSLDHLVSNKGSEIPALMTDSDFHRRQFGKWLSDAKA